MFILQGINQSYIGTRVFFFAISTLGAVLNIGIHNTIKVML